MPYSDPEKRRAYGRDWMRRNPEKARAAMQRWRVAHPDEHRAQGRARYARHSDRLKAQIAAYHRANPDVVRAKREKHRALRRAHRDSSPRRDGTPCRLLRACLPTAARSDRWSRITACPSIVAGVTGSKTSCPRVAFCNARKHLMTEEEFRTRLAAERDPAQRDREVT